MPDILEIDYKALVAENLELSEQLAKLRVENVDLSAAFLENVTKLGIICSKFGIKATLQQTDTNPFFSFAVDERLKRERMVRLELATAHEHIEKLTAPPVYPATPQD